MYIQPLNIIPGADVIKAFLFTGSVQTQSLNYMDKGCTSSSTFHTERFSRQSNREPILCDRENGGVMLLRNVKDLSKLHGVTSQKTLLFVFCLMIYRFVFLIF